MTLRFCLTCNAHHPTGSTCPKRERQRYAASSQRRTRSTVRWQQARAAARRRDGNRCRRCGSTRNLQVHHIVSLANGGARYDLENLETLCFDCHRRVEGGTSRTWGRSLTPPSSISRKKLPGAGPVPRFSRRTLTNVPDDDGPLIA
jgi:5-methylcytosine-specific restriction endonuclease McrA